MPVQFLKGDLFAYHDREGLDALAHGCNCAGAMGRGIAVQFRRRFSKMYLAYREICRKQQLKLGGVFVWEEDDGDPPLTVYNLGTQKDKGIKAELPDIRSALSAMLQHAEENSIATIGLPRIGAGLGKQCWGSIRAIIETLAKATPVTLVVFEEYVKAT
jgi:O-acetyl-ADP-ribose deacetylase (regulator of RNase III)